MPDDCTPCIRYIMLCDFIDRACVNELGSLMTRIKRHQDYCPLCQRDILAAMDASEMLFGQDDMETLMVLNPNKQN